MNEIVFMILALVVGFGLGILFFGGLWFTVKKGTNSKTPAIWFVVSSIIRIAITLIGFYYISSGNLRRLLICTGGFIIARFVVMRFTKLKDEKQVSLKKEVYHETQS